MAEQGRIVLTVEAVHALHRLGPVTVNAVADEIGIDQSGASRLVKTASAAGFLQMQPAIDDGRRRHITITSAGHTLLDEAHAWQEAVFGELTVDWSPGRRFALQQAMLELLERSHDVDVPNVRANARRRHE